MKKEIRFPTIIGLIVLIAGIVGGVYLSSQSSILNIKASGDCEPTNLQITNITNNSASVFFQTTATCNANIKINGLVVQDYRVQVLSASAESKTKVHYFLTNNLKDSTLYQFEIISGGKSYTNTSYKLKTAQKPSTSVPTSNLAWGKVYTPQNNPATGSIVFMNIPGGASLSALVTSSGNWNISLATSFNQTLSNWFTPSEATDEEIIVISENVDPTIIQASTSRNNPVPDIILGQNYFSAEASPTSVSGIVDNLTPTLTKKKLTISYPTENETIYTYKPEFIGTGPQNTSLAIKLLNSSGNWEVIPDSVGNWRWTPPTGLLPGLNTITISVDNQRISRSFTVQSPADNQLSFEASGSASPTSVPSPTVIPTAAPSSYPTLTPTTIPSATPTSARSTRPSTDSGVPVTGNGLVTVSIIIFSLVLVITSLQLFKKSDNF